MQLSLGCLHRRHNSVNVEAYFQAKHSREYKEKNVLLLLLRIVIFHRMLSTLQLALVNSIPFGVDEAFHNWITALLEIAIFGRIGSYTVFLK